MKYLKNYKLFLEADDFDIKPTDKADIQSAKERLNDLKNNISEYKNKKNEIDKLYLNAATDEDIKSKLKNMFGEEIKNPFVSEYLHISELKRRINKLQNDISTDKLKKDDFQTQMNDTEDNSIKNSLGEKISSIDKRIGTNDNEIQSLKKDIDESEKQLEKKMDNLEKEMLENFKKISTFI